MDEGMKRGSLGGDPGVSVTYDNVLGTPDTLEAASQQEIAGGSIVVHKQ